MSKQRPVLVGIGTVQQCEFDMARMREAVALMIDAAQAAILDTGAPSIQPHIQRIYAPQGLWHYPDPARLVADFLGVSATTILSDFGILQQGLLNDACECIASDAIHCALVIGGEAKFRQLQAGIQGVELLDTHQECEPDETWRPEAELMLTTEAEVGLGMPVGYYALIESALRAARGESIESNRDRIAAIYEQMSVVAENNPHAWKRQRVPAEQIRNAVGKNRMLAFPYTKLHNSEWNVDQACALLLCSESLADALGIAQDKRIYPLAGSESNHMQCLSQRKNLHEAPGARLSLEAALAHAGLTTANLDWLELYSCFPSAVQIFAEAVGVNPLHRDITVTGGMSFAGGPLNNYVLQATCRMIELLRGCTDRRCTGAVSSVSGILTKQAWGLWSNQPSDNEFAFLDVTAEVARQAPAMTVLEHYQGVLTVRACTVLFQGRAASRAIVIGDTPTGERVLAWSEAPVVMESMQVEEWCGRLLEVDADGQFVNMVAS